LLAFEVALALGEVELRAARSEGRARLRNLEQDAKSKEFFPVARPAREASLMTRPTVPCPAPVPALGTLITLIRSRVPCASAANVITSTAARVILKRDTEFLFVDLASRSAELIKAFSASELLDTIVACFDCMIDLPVGSFV
jgi:hypothetical protein